MASAVIFVLYVYVFLFICESVAICSIPFDIMGMRARTLSKIWAHDPTANAVASPA